jgi:hypothetical protein
MDFDILEKLGKVAGIAGITVGAVVIIFSGIIQKKIFPGLTKEQGFRIIKMIILFAGLLAVIGIGAWIYTDYQKNKIDRTNQLKVKHVIGYIKDIDNSPISNVNIEVAQYDEIIDYTDQDGKFVIKINGAGKKYIDLVLKHKSYKLVRKKVKIDFDNEVDEIELKEITLISSKPPKQEDIIQGNPGKNTPKKTKSSPHAGITLNYMGDDYNCALNLEITIGDRAIIPTSNTHQISGLTPGYNSYTIHGTIDCGTMGSCLADGQDQLYIENGADYYIMWLYETCEIGILTLSEYQKAIGGY